MTDFDAPSAIVLVGNAPSLLLRPGLGAIIDAFETVVRFNNFVTVGYESFAGTKQRGGRGRKTTTSRRAPSGLSGYCFACRASMNTRSARAKHRFCRDCAAITPNRR